jgi:hypothetical protein
VEFTKPAKPTGSDDWGIRALYLYEGDSPAYIRADYKSQNVSLFEHSWDGPDGYFVFRKGDMRWVSCNYTGQGVRLGEDLPTLRIFSHEAVAPRVEGLDYFQQIKLNYVGGFPDNEKFIDLNRIVYDKDWNVVTCELGAGKCDIFFKLSLLDREGKVMEYGVRNRAEAKGSILYGKNLTVEIPLHKELPNEVPSEMGLKDINPEDIGGVSIRLDDQSL